MERREAISAGLWWWVGVQPWSKKNKKVVIPDPVRDRTPRIGYSTVWNEATESESGSEQVGI
jgi:hypothetical protein